MEVHHHASHHGPKKWKEYITEFLMLFTAVTLGFLAENLREEQIIAHQTESVSISQKPEAEMIPQRSNAIKIPLDNIIKK